jgi:molybdopterin-containing oxidoreductase family iron-sulfur binding subunit
MEVQNYTLVMLADLQRALKKPVKERHWGMVVDQRKCIGCHTCTAACRAENVVPPGVVYLIVMEKEMGKYPMVRKKFTPRPCMQCQNPHCAPVCPVGATWKREDGVVIVDYKQCIGCRYCLSACPYDARSSDFGEFYTDTTPDRQPYETRHSYELGHKWIRKGHKSPIGNARKCHFCLHRVHKGLLPACVSTCVGRALFFGDLNDPKSVVIRMAVLNRGYRLKEELGTEPSVYYLT